MAEILTAMPLESLFTNPNSAQTRSRSILSFLSNPLGKHNRNLYDIAIELDDPFRTYTPAQTVKGHISLTVQKGFDITHLVVALHGYAKVYKHQVLPGEGVPAPEGLVNGQGSRGVQYHGSGLTSLFQQEQILCGNGFLKKQAYKFAFEVLFPSKGLPSAIDFERGTVSYMITATLTRPTTMSPVTSRSAKVKFQDIIDIESMYNPKTRVISLEPLSRRGKVKIVKPGSSVTTRTTSSAGAGVGRLTRNNTQNSNVSRSTNSVSNPPLSPSPSEDTVQTNGTPTSSPSIRVGDNDIPARKASPENSDAPSNTTSSSANTITATAELPRQGALPGDMVPIRVSVTNGKTDSRGLVIATLYRLARIDMHPPLPIPNRSGKQKKMEYEDVYPKSRTGLGGLYFSAASPNSAFRMDLAQSSTMLIVNPSTVTTDITTSLKIPDASFPTISNVPGGMISFTYHIEVVVDLFGKLGETRFWPRLTSSEPTFSQSSGGGNQITSDWSQQILDTAALRRTKSIITFEMSLVVGTQDSGRKRRQNKQTDDHVAENTMLGPEQVWHDSDYYDGAYEGQYYDEAGYPHYEAYGYDYGHNQNYYPEYPPSAPELFPPPDPQEEMDEKTRLRRQEQLLLPSEPPQEEASSRSAIPYVPTAPDLSSEALSNGIDHQNDGSRTPSIMNQTASVASSTRSGDTVRPYSTSPPPAHALADPAGITDDKQELERHRLLAQTSAPATEDSELAGSSTAVASLAPSAPMLDEHHEYSVQTLAHHHEGSDLPQYER